MNIKMFLFFLFVVNISVRGFSQEDITIQLVPKKEYEKLLTFRPSPGEGKEVRLPLAVSWDFDTKLIKVEFRSNRNNPEIFIYSFPKLMFHKNVMKIKKDVWFDKGMKKYSKDKTVEKSIDNETLVNVKLEEENNTIKTLEFRDPESKMTFYFREIASKKGSICKIPIKLYVASKETKSKRDKKIEYPIKFTLCITLQDFCDNPDFNSIVESLLSEIENMRTQQETITSELGLLPNLSCAKIKELKDMPSGKEKEFNPNKNPQYNNCEYLKTVIKIYNETLGNRNNAIRNYNNKLSEIKRKCSGAENINCKILYQTNEKLAELLLDIKNSNQTNLSSFKQEYEKIKKNVADPDYKKCKEYKAFEDLCNRIDARLK